MEKTLDEFLAEVDRWKRVSDDSASMSIEQRKLEEQEARAWLERKLGRKLQEAPPRNQFNAVTAPNDTSTPRT